jgi:hypothetical protein
MTPARDSYYAILGGLLLGSAGIDVVDMDDLFADPPKRGANRIVPSVPGRAVRPRVADQLTAPIEVHLYGEWTQDGVRVPEPDRVGQLYDHLAALRQVTAQTGVVDLTVHLTPTWSITVDCQIESGGTLIRLNPSAGKVVLEVTLPDGPLNLTSEE